MLDIVVCVLGWVLIAWHTWALKYHFNMAVVPAGVRLISLFVIASAILLTYLSFAGEQPVAAQVVGAGLIAASYWLFWATMRASSKAQLLAAFDPDLPHGLLTTGPYAHVRHPFYTSYLMQWIGWAIAAWSIWAIVPVVMMTTTYWFASRDEETKFASTKMAPDYERFRATTGRFLPKPKFGFRR